jgi:rRNA maturation protein Nop10
MATIKATCPMCGDVDLAPRQVHVRVVEAIEDAMSRRTYTFGCPTCHEDVEKSADEEVVRLLSTAGVAIERVPVPAEARESHYGDPISYDDLLDLAMALEQTDDLMALLSQQKIA